MATPRVGPFRVRHHADDRRAFYGDIFSNPDGDINVVYLTAFIPIAWHRHHHQTDRLFCVAGTVCVGLRYDAPGASYQRWAMLEKGETLTIPPGTYHGYEGMTQGAILVQYNTPKYNPDDEARHPIDAEMPWEPT